MPHPYTHAHAHTHTHTHAHAHAHTHRYGVGSSPSPSQSPVPAGMVCMLPPSVIGATYAGLTSLPSNYSCASYGGKLVSKSKYVDTCVKSNGVYPSYGVELDDVFVDDAQFCYITGKTGSPSSFGKVGSYCWSNNTYPSGQEALCLN